MDDLNVQRKRVYEDLNYLTKNKITLLRNNTMSPEEIGREEIRLKNELEFIEERNGAHKEAASEMLKYVVTFSELVNLANLYYKQAIDIEKREITTQVFTELVFVDRNLANYTAKEGFAALLKRRSVSSGAPDYLFTELLNIYPAVRVSMEKLKKLPCIKKLKAAA